MYKATNQPEKYLSIIIDGMDQSKVSMPNVPRESDATEKLPRLKMHATGVLVRGITSQSFCYLWGDRSPKDPNLTIAILLDVLNRIDSHDEVLYLQMDGASGENKNKYVLMFCACLVQLGVFKKVKISFLPVGHTHEDIDQMFSRFSIALRAKGANTAQACAELLALAFKPTPVVGGRLQSLDRTVRIQAVDSDFIFSCVQDHQALTVTLWFSTEPEWLGYDSSCFATRAGY